MTITITSFGVVGSENSRPGLRLLLIFTGRSFNGFSSGKFHHLVLKVDGGGMDDDQDPMVPSSQAIVLPGFEIFGIFGFCGYLENLEFTENFGSLPASPPFRGKNRETSLPLVATWALQVDVGRHRDRKFFNPRPLREHLRVFRYLFKRASTVFFPPSALRERSESSQLRWGSALEEMFAGKREKANLRYKFDREIRRWSWLAAQLERSVVIDGLRRLGEAYEALGYGSWVRSARAGKVVFGSLRNRRAHGLWEKRGLSVEEASAELSSLEAFVYPVPASVLVSEQMADGLLPELLGTGLIPRFLAVLQPVAFFGWLSCPLLRLLSIPCLHHPKACSLLPFINRVQRRRGVKSAGFTQDFRDEAASTTFCRDLSAISAEFTGFRRLFDSPS
ncbi:hypothetical protein M5K25_010950 [Dendrobium thyrsiflorum]|uniref:Uncharacterized protein n=1 Tax=Dendrobium thyrsiflorum TaxID=117978 RepID=A0ABD0V118_DENTH